jgi:superfamily I DNA and RNA helicase
MKNNWWVGPKQLNSEQKAVVSLPLDGNHLILGPPGCGKTNLILLRANYLALSGLADVKILVFTRTLQEFIRTGSTQYAFPASNVLTAVKWKQDLLKEYSYEYRVNGGFSQLRRFLTEQVAKLVEAEGLEDLYDCILLDEAQDYSAEELRLFAVLGKRLFAVADGQQRIYPGDDPIQTLQELTDHQHTLKYHYRCGREPCKVADAIRRGSRNYIRLEPTMQYDENSHPSSVKSTRCGSIRATGESIVIRLRNQVKAYPEDLLGVIAPRREEMLRLGEVIKESDFAGESTVQTDEDHVSFTPDTKIVVCTLHAAKGLEFRCLHIVGCEYFPHFHDRQKRMAYTGVTRAKTSVFLYSVDPLPTFLEQALNAVRPLPDLPSLEAAFKGRM